MTARVLSFSSIDSAGPIFPFGGRGTSPNTFHKAVAAAPGGPRRVSSLSSIDSAGPILPLGGLGASPHALHKAVAAAAGRTRRVSSLSSLDRACPIFHFGASNLERPRGWQSPVKRTMLERSREHGAAAPGVNDAWGLKDRAEPAGASAADCFVSRTEAIKTGHAHRRAHRGAERFGTVDRHRAAIELLRGDGLRADARGRGRRDWRRSKSHARLATPMTPPRKPEGGPGDRWARGPGSSRGPRSGADGE